MLNLEDMMTMLEEQGTSARPLGAERRGLYGGFITTPPGTYEVPRLGYHALTIVPGGPFDMTPENGWLATPPTAVMPEDMVFFAARSALRSYVPPFEQIRAAVGMPNAHGFSFFVPEPLLQAKIEDVTRREHDPEAPMQGLALHPSPQLRWFARQIRREIVEDRAGRRSMLDALTDALLLEFARSYDAVQQGITRTGQLTATQREHAIALMDQAIDSTINLRDIADALQLSPATLTRRFSATFNLTPTEYLSVKRFERAVHQLAKTDLSIAEIAYNCGFSSQAHFTTRFSAEFDTSPARFRAMARRGHGRQS